MNEYMKVAKDLADDNLITNVGGPFGACIVKDGKIIGRGSNHVLENNDPITPTLTFRHLSQEVTNGCSDVASG